MARKTKLWGGLIGCVTRVFGKSCDDRQHRCLVKATSQKRAVQLINMYADPSMSLGHLRGYWAITGNTVEVAVGEAVEGEAVWVVKGQRYSIKSPEQYERLETEL